MTTQDDILAKPRPPISMDNKPFWDGCRRHELLLPVCEECGKAHLPPGPVCPHCFSEQLHWKRASGKGHISTWVVVHKPWFPAFAAEIPYNVVQVELEEGPRLTTHVVDAKGHELAVGQAVEVVFHDVDADLTMPHFRRV